MNELSEYVLYFHLINCGKPVLKIGSEELSGKLAIEIMERDSIIIWENQGMFKLIPNSILRNLKTQYENARRIDALYPRIEPPIGLNKISWDQGISIPEAVVQILLSKEKFGDTKSTAESTSENQTEQP